jgi:chromate reductase
MQRTPNILAFSGSSRKGSFNAALLKQAVAAVRAAGADVTVIDLRELSLPLYDGDLEAEHGVPENVKALRARMMAHDGFLVASPEYNGSVSALLKNTLDWCSRPAGGVDGLAPYRGKTVALLSASVSPFGGARGLTALRSIMAKMGAVVLGEDVAVPFAQNAFDDNGALTHAGTDQLLQGLAANFVKLTHKLHVVPAVDGSPR